MVVAAIAEREPSVEELIERFDLATVAAFAAMRLPPIDADEADGEPRAPAASAAVTVKLNAKCGDDAET